MNPRAGQISKSKPKENHKTWAELKLQGSEHYKMGTTEPIDLYKSKGTFKPFALCSIIKYSTRNLNQDLSVRDIEKIIHYAELLIAEKVENENKTKSNQNQG